LAMRHHARVATIYVYMPDEGTDTWRPVEALYEGDSLYRLADTRPPTGEVWEFAPGALVRCAWRELSEGPQLVAVAAA
jgi:hypothetical protein